MSEVSIGDKVWCAAGVFIHPGVEIGDNTFINSRSVVSGTIPPGSVVEGNPASVVYPMERVKRKMSPRRVDAALAQILSGFAEIGLRRELGLTEIEKSQNGLRFPYEGQVYGVTIIPSTETSSQATESGEDERQIFIVNCPGWSTSGSGAMVFDMASRLTSFSDDPIHIALRSFMQRYYGVRFRFEAPS
jgi:hypothetical protein